MQKIIFLTVLTLLTILTLPAIYVLTLLNANLNVPPFPTWQSCTVKISSNKMDTTWIHERPCLTTFPNAKNLFEPLKKDYWN